MTCANGPGWWNCCPEGCTALTPNVGDCEWIVVSGTWPVAGEQCTSAEGMCLLSCLVPGSRVFKVEIHTSDEKPGQSWLAIANSNAEATRYYFARFTRVSDVECSLQVGLKTPAGETIYHSESNSDRTGDACQCPPAWPEDLSTSRTISLCLSAKGLGASATIPTPGLQGEPRDTYNAWEPLVTLNQNSDYVGLGAEGGTVADPVKFGAFEAWASVDYDIGTPCIGCGCFQLSSGTFIDNPDALLVTITGTTGCCKVLEGYEFTLNRRGQCSWDGELTLGDVTICVAFAISDGVGAITMRRVCSGSWDYSPEVGGTASGAPNPVNYLIPAFCTYCGGEPSPPDGCTVSQWISSPPGCTDDPDSEYNCLAFCGSQPPPFELGPVSSYYFQVTEAP